MSVRNAANTDNPLLHARVLKGLAVEELAAEVEGRVNEERAELSTKVLVSSYARLYEQSRHSRIRSGTIRTGGNRQHGHKVKRAGRRNIRQSSKLHRRGGQRGLPRLSMFALRTNLRSEVLDLQRVAALDAKLAERLRIVVKQLPVGSRDALAVHVELDRRWSCQPSLRLSRKRCTHLDLASDGRLERSDSRGVLVELNGEREALRRLRRAWLDSHSERHRASKERDEDNRLATRLASSFSLAIALLGLCYPARFSEALTEPIQPNKQLHLPLRSLARLDSRWGS